MQSIEQALDEVRSLHEQITRRLEESAPDAAGQSCGAWRALLPPIWVTRQCLSGLKVRQIVSVTSDQDNLEPSSGPILLGAATRVNRPPSSHQGSLGPSPFG